MKTIANLSLFVKCTAATLIFVTSTSFAGTKADNPNVREVVIGVSDAYIPGGFDSDTDAYVVVSGIFPNGCYKWKGANVRHLNAFNHTITSIANVSQGMCLMVLVPFTKDVRLGKLSSGTHNLRFLNGDGTYLEKQLAVE